VRLLELKWASEDDLKAIDKDVRAIVTDAAEFAQNDPEPDSVRALHRHHARKGREHHAD
jgi:TPP-dependent pyruvate/acetoin dehydrogenase alpha subunit